MVLPHDIHHFIAQIIELDAGERDLFLVKLSHEILQNETVWITFWIVIVSVMILLAVARRIKDMEHLPL